MRLCWLSNCPWTPYGYGVQTGLFTPRLVAAGHPIAVISTYGHQGVPITWNGVQVYGSAMHPYGMDIMHGHSEQFKADALLTLLDVQVMEPDALQGTRWISWTPVDHVNLQPVVLEKVRRADIVIAMSKHGRDQFQQAGIDSAYIPCGVDTGAYHPLPMAEARQAMKLPADKFIVGMVAANKGSPSRKAFQANIAAFAALRARHPDCLLYLHTRDGIANGPGWDTENLTAYCDALGLRWGYSLIHDADGLDVLFAHQYGLALGYDTSMMANLYSSMDVHTLVTMGEGFGIPLIEAQACGTPVVTGSWTSMPELCFSGWKIDHRDAEMLFTPMGAFQALPHPGAIAEALEAAYQAKGVDSIRARAREGAMQYDADLITRDYWLPFLQEAEARLQEPIAIESFDRNMAVLR
jgi:glycosyltransferase involved in cell wall biosynthesis